MELVYVICSLATTELCEEHAAAVYTPSPVACFVGAQAELVQLTPAGWRVAHWRCVAAQADGDPERATVALLPF